MFDSICDSPLDVEKPLQLANSLGESGNPIGELIRLQHQWLNCRWDGEENHLDYLGKVQDFKREHPDLYGFLGQDSYHPVASFGMLTLSLSAKDFLYVNKVVGDQCWQRVAGLPVRLGARRVTEMVQHPRFQTVRNINLEEIPGAHLGNQLDSLLDLELPLLRALTLDSSRLSMGTATRLPEARWWGQINWLEIALDQQEASVGDVLPVLAECQLQGLSLPRCRLESLEELVNHLPKTIRRIYLDNGYQGHFNADWARLENLDGIHYNPRKRRHGLPQLVYPRPYPYLWHGISLVSY